jgi:type VI secretion system protein ImpH
MGSEAGREGLDLRRSLLDASFRFDFFQAVRLLEHCRREAAGGRQDPQQQGHGVGRDVSPGDEVVRFRLHPSLSFPTGAISEIRDARPEAGDRRDSRPLEMLVSFLGMTGPNGVLPRHYTEIMLRQLREKDSSLRDFLDLFNHRLISLFYRAWEKYSLPITYERSRLDGPDGEPDPVTQGLYCLVGLGTGGLRGRLELDDEVFLHYSGHFSHFPRSALALECLLADHLEMPVVVLQCQGQWLALEPEDQARMPSKAQPLGQNNRLGVNLVVGERVWEVQSKFRLRIGPLRWSQFRSLMPNGPALRPLCQVTRLYVGPTFDFDVQPTLRPEEIPPCQLTSSAEGPYLGWNTWIPRQTIGLTPVSDAIFQIETE